MTLFKNNDFVSIINKCVLFILIFIAFTIV